MMMTAMCHPSLKAENVLEDNDDNVSSKSDGSMTIAMCCLSPTVGMPLDDDDNGSPGSDDGK